MKIRILAILGIALASILSSGCFKVVDPGDRAVEVKLGQVSKDAIQPGLIFPYNPFTTDYEIINVQTQRFNDKTDAYTKDVQRAAFDYTVNFNLDPVGVVSTYSDVGIEWESKLVPQVVLDTLKAVIGSYDAETLIGKREEARAKIQEALRAALAPKHIIVTSFQINNIDYSNEFEKAVEAKVVAIQNAIREQNVTVQIREQATQTVITAKASAESMGIQGDALARNQKLVEWEAVKKWDGKLPQYMLGSNSTPFINIK